MSIQEVRDMSEVTIDSLLIEAIQNNASDLHLACNTPPRFRIDGDLLVTPGYRNITDDWLRDQIEKIAPSSIWNAFGTTKEGDFAHEIESYGRFRVNIFVQKGTSSSVLRIIPNEIKTLEQLQAPKVIGDQLIQKPRGLVLVTGETGSGKSTTLAAMIDAINENKRNHIITIEDPIEFIHKNKMSLVNQREVSQDTASFHEALRRVLRQDPDVILIGELRDPETISIALTAAETGHLVLATIHTQSATKTIDRIIDSFEYNQQSQIRSQLSDTLQAVISQTLVKKKNGGRTAATEILINNNAIANNIREGKLSQIYSSIQTGRNSGMHTLDQDLQRLVRAGTVEKDKVIHLLNDKAALDGIITRTNDWSN